MIVVPPALVDRPLVHYVAQPRAVTMDSIGAAIDDALGEVESWLASRGVAAAGPPVVRYRVIDMERELLIEVGVPVAAPVDVPDGLVCDSLPAGTYGAATYRGVEEGVEGNAALIAWARENGVEWDRWDADAGDAFACRVEVLLGDPDVNPDPSMWETEVAILVKGS
ncbi:GyrI-like domain-containing protein [Demequina sp. TTPB684]|uniref:GyrI-like domain-containing protein n=1 Tax=unclassified Demequina TaxID=2620311 RepID=UPI001CF34732|nr:MULTISPECIES: GyrI-like domain-containing protein [unclassified Demequina]MCB2412860.1 GyrI-like domain-containing protein [Demequina sp. TTPB684]UPU88163.1 GyrI-like domain-containing protein [Demequina sp. TMPB413]